MIRRIYKQEDIAGKKKGDPQSLKWNLYIFIDKMAIGKINYVGWHCTCTERERARMISTFKIIAQPGYLVVSIQELQLVVQMFCPS